MDNLADHGYSGIDNGVNVHHCLQGIRSTEFEEAFNVVHAKAEKYGNDFDVTVLSQSNDHQEGSLFAICQYCQDWMSAKEAQSDAIY